MPSSKSERRQRAMGGVIGVGVLALAMLYHFFPEWLHVQRDESRMQRATAVDMMSPPMGFEQRPQGARGDSKRIDEVDAGPPLSLAPHAVIAARLRPAPATSAALASASPESAQVNDLLTRAADALGRGNLSGDAESAMELYLKVLALRPDSPRARAGLGHVQQRLVAEIEDDLSSGDVDAARVSLGVLRRLPGAREESKRLQTSLDALQQVQPLLAKAADLLKKGQDLQPAQPNALAVYRKVLELDPANSVARQGLHRIQRKLLDNALGAVAQDDFDGADKALARAAQVDPDSTLLQDTRGRIEGIRRQRAEARLEQAGTALDGGDLALAIKLRDQALNISPDVPGVKTFDQRLHNARVYASYQPGQDFSDSYVDLGGHGPTMVVIPTGSFMMGSPDSESGHMANESPMHKVTISRGFAVSRTEITVAQFREFVRNSGYVPDSVRLQGSNVYDGQRGTMRDESRATWEDNYAGRKSRHDHPVVNVSWRDAQAYVKWLSRHTGKSYRLLSEAEYEYVMRGGTDTPYWWGTGTPAREVENLAGSRDRSPLRRSWTNAFPGYRDGYWGDAPAGHFQPNPFGLYDIDGNVSEWVEDCWHDNYIRAPLDGSAWVNPGCSLRMIRGSSWGSSPAQARSAFRVAAGPQTRSGRVGFRIARQL
jgi:formylglycine-generating enzyme required for sulfatase activity